MLVTTRSPDPNLPLLGETKFFSMNADTPCQTRYGLTGLRAFPLGQRTATDLQKAMEAITDPSRKGKTWRTVANGKFETSDGRKKERADLLVVYVEGRPDIDDHVADLFGTDPGEQQEQFVVDAEAVCKALEGIVRERPHSRLILILMRKADKEKKQVVLAESPTVDEVLKGARWWQQAVANVPEVTLPLPAPRGQKAISGVPTAPYPDQVVRLLSEEWVMKGTRSNKVEGSGLGEILDLMLRKPGKWEQVARHMLDLALRRTDQLLLGLFGAVYTGNSERWNPYPLRSREIALRAVSVFGILLDALGCRKEVYMTETAFLLGRLLALADTLHREYCRQVRDGGIPPQLIGNALMPVAADRPSDALDRLRERMLIYQAWATKGNGEEYRLAKWAVGQMGDLCHQLAQLLPLPAHPNQAFRAELFLGYMARSSGKPQAGGTDNGPAKER